MFTFKVLDNCNAALCFLLFTLLMALLSACSQTSRDLIPPSLCWTLGQSQTPLEIGQKVTQAA